MSNNDIIDVQPIDVKPSVIEEAAAAPKPANSYVKPVLFAAAGLAIGLATSFATQYFIAKDDVTPKIVALEQQLASQKQATLILISETQKSTANLAKKLDDLSLKVDNLPAVKEVKTIENSDGLKTQIDELKAELAKISPKMSLLEKEQSGSKGNQAMNLSYIILNKIERGDNISGDLKNLSQIAPQIQTSQLSNLVEKPLVTKEILLQALKSVKLVEAKVDDATGSWVDKLKASAGSLVKVTRKEGEVLTPLKEIEAAVVLQNYSKALALWATIRPTIADDKGFEAKMTLAQKQALELDHFKDAITKMGQ